ncbi:esterase family protein [Lacihabitans sp. LS3-19]|uniref:alpha/beta hydrolase n=1 Tax=Lacihabitans sp. LS3-19 TaxID=2487335 RepID=UPI0020CEE219|nr:alpha/beta hydrolase-fold protein [Lacihabitans sp. LS3-19]
MKRDVVYDLIIPSSSYFIESVPTLLMNDGQDYEQLELETLARNHYQNGGEAFVFVGIHTNENRLKEYGTSNIPDYKGRGSLATAYMNFIVSELLISLRNNYPIIVNFSKTGFCGFSLGGLSAIDIAWENPHLFSKVGVFSGSFWWRDKAYEDGYQDDIDRIMHNKIRNSEHKKGLKFWFECGTNDETADRNNNGIIDAIEDTLDLISELRKKNYSDEDITYVEVKGGEHNFGTWKKVFPNFLEWFLKN